MLRTAALVFLVAACAQAPEVLPDEGKRAAFPWVATIECHAAADAPALRELDAFFRREVEAGRALPAAVSDDGGLRRWTYYVRDPAVATGSFADAVRLSGIEAATIAVHPGAD